MKVVKVYLKGFGNQHIVYKDLDSLLDETKRFFEMDGVGEGLALIKAEMTEEEFKALPDFEGW